VCGAGGEEDGKAWGARGGRGPRGGGGFVEFRGAVWAGGPRVEGGGSRRICGVEVTAPGLDDAEVVEVVKRERARAVPAGGEPDEGAGAPVADRPGVRVDVPGKLLRNRLLPVAPPSPAEVLG